VTADARASSGVSSGTLVLAALYLEPTAEQEDALRVAAARVEDWSATLAALEAHGIVGLARRNLGHANVVLPDDVRARLAERAAAMRAIERGFRLTLERFLVAAARDGFEVTLLKGASLALDLYPEPGLRTQGDLDLLVAERDLGAAVAAARKIGLAPPPGALPAWWYRLAHFHLKLLPADGLQRELELHWHLHPSAQLYTVRRAELFRRRKRVTLAGQPAWTLDPLDRLLHLVTHLLRHCPLALVGPDELLAAAAEPRSPLRMKWLLDLRAELERAHATFPVAELAERAAEWNAEADLALTLSWLRARLGLSKAADSWAAQVLRALPELPALPATTALPHAERPLAGFDLRASALLAFPRWVWPHSSRFGRLAGNGPRAVLRRGAHAARVIGRGALVAAATPIALLARALGTSTRRAPLGPEETLALAARARELARSDEVTA
jgi:hypothetical protein